MSKKLKYLIETSAVRAAVGPTTTRQREHFEEVVDDGTLFTSVYIRMEFIRRWICTCIYAALVVAQCRSVSEALIILEQDFSSRNVKADLAVISEHLTRLGVLQDQQSASEELGRTAVEWLRRFDKVFRSRITNKSNCKRGGRELDVDFNTLLSDLHRFYESFVDPVTDCEINRFLNLSNANSEASKLLNSVTDREVPSCKHLRKYQQSKKWITCKECERIGDSAISLELSRSWHLIYLDGAFNHLCAARGMIGTQLKSIPALEKEN